MGERFRAHLRRILSDPNSQLETWRLEFAVAYIGRLRSIIAFVAALGITVSRVGADLFVVLLQGGQILTGLGELTFLHALTDVPVHEGTLGVPVAMQTTRPTPYTRHKHH